MRRVVLAFFFCAIAMCARAQSVRESPARTGQTAAISGRVVAAATGDPLPNARVALTSAAVGARVVLSDVEGRFSFAAAAGRHTLVASKSGYARHELTLTASGDAVEI